MVLIHADINALDTPLVKPSSIPLNLEVEMDYATVGARCNKGFHENDYGKDDATAALGKQHFELLCITLEDTRERSDGIACTNITIGLKVPDRPAPAVLLMLLPWTRCCHGSALLSRTSSHCCE